MNKKNKALQIFKLLLNGGEIEMSGYKVSLQETEDDKLVLCFRGTVVDSKHSHKEYDKYFGYELSINQFINECDKIPENEMYSTIMGQALTEMKLEKANRSERALRRRDEELMQQEEV